MPAHMLMTTLKLLAACLLVLAIATRHQGRTAVCWSESRHAAGNSAQPNPGRPWAPTTSTAGRARATLEGRPGVDRAQSAHAPDEADARGVRRPRADLGLA